MSVTLSDLITATNDLTDNEGNAIADSTSVIRFINEAIKRCEAVIHNLQEDYFYNETTISVVDGTSAYDLPSDIYARKIRGIWYNDGSKVYEILPIQDRQTLLYLKNSSNSQAAKRYNITNDSTNGVKINIYPTPSETDSTSYVIMYIRNAKQLVNLTDVLDIPEYEQYIIDFARRRVLQKEVVNPMLTTVTEDLINTESLMVDTLQESVPDGNNEMSLDTSAYDEQGDYGYDGEGEY